MCSGTFWQRSGSSGRHTDATEYFPRVRIGFGPKFDYRHELRRCRKTASGTGVSICKFLGLQRVWIPVRQPLAGPLGTRRWVGMENIWTRVPFPYEISVVAMVTRTRTLGSYLVFVTVAVCICLCACNLERATLVRVVSGPTFVLSGSGRLAIFTVYGQRNGERISFPHPDVAPILWQIRAADGYFNGGYVDNLRVTYGQVPVGYTQTVPSGPSAPTLTNGLIYSFFAETSGAGSKDGFFYLGKEQPIQTIVPNLCLVLVGGHETRVNCSDKLPYREPFDLESVAIANRTK
jgi:hypothetical protein